MLYHLGVLRLLQALRLRRKAVVLMYHRVLGEDDRMRTGSHPGIVVSRETFARQMAVLKRRFTVLSVEEFAECLERRSPFPSSSCLITFDDGWIDNFTNALPVLREQAFPAVVFLPVNFVGSQRMFWREALTEQLARAVVVVRQDPSRRAAFARILDESGLTPLLDLPAADSRASISESLGVFKQSAPAILEALVTRLAEELGPLPSSEARADGFIDWTQARAMARDGISFGGHGAEHRLLTTVSSEEAATEIQTSRTVIAASLGESAPAFSYPNGDWSPAIAEQVRRSGFRLAFTTEPGPVDCADNPFALRRINIHEDVTDTTPMFLARVVGLV